MALAGRAGTDLSERLARMPEADARRVVTVAYQQLLAAGEEGAKATSLLHASQVQVQEARRALQESRALASAQADAAARELDARLTATQREYEAKLRFVFEQLQVQNLPNSSSVQGYLGHKKLRPPLGLP